MASIIILRFKVANKMNESNMCELLVLCQRVFIAKI